MANNQSSLIKLQVDITLNTLETKSFVNFIGYFSQTLFEVLPQISKSVSFFRTKFSYFWVDFVVVLHFGGLGSETKYSTSMVVKN